MSRTKSVPIRDDLDQFPASAYPAQPMVDQTQLGYQYYDAQMPAQVPGMDPSGASWGYPETQSYTQYMPSSQSTAHVNTNLFKTKLCRHFQSKGMCNMGDQCNFAHGEAELRYNSGGGANPEDPSAENGYFQKPAYNNNSSFNYSQSKYYKTVLCRNYQTKGSCQFGEKCKFAHGEEDLKQGPSGFNNVASSYYTAPMMAQPPMYPTYEMNNPYQNELSVNPEFMGAPGYDMAAATDSTNNYNYNYPSEPLYYQGFEYDNPPMEAYPSDGGMQPTPGYMGDGSQMGFGNNPTTQ